MSNQDLKILCLDDEPEILDLYRTVVLEAGFSPLLIGDPTAALDAYRDHMQDLALVLCDFKMPKMDGFQFRRAILPAGTAVPFVVVSSYVSREMALEALELKITAFHDKPIGQEALLAVIKKEAAKRVDSIRESQALEATFIDEATTIVDDMEPILLSLENERGNQDSLNLLYRAAHTLKGSSGVLDTDILAKYVHKYEDIISDLRKGNTTLTDEIYATLLKGYDRIKELVASLANKTIRSYSLAEIVAELAPRARTPGQEAAPAPAQVSDKAQGASPQVHQADHQKAKPKESISVPIGLLDDLAGLSGEITVIRNMVNKIVRSLERKFAGERDIQSLGELFDEMHKINSTIQSRITDLRKVPMSGVLKPIPRILRDLSRELTKKTRLTLVGEALRIDNSLAQVCSNSLVHLIRNSVDHGLETPPERLKIGKPEEGSITVACVEEGEEIVIVVRDDGRGIDAAKIKAKALEKGLHSSEQLAAMTDKQALGIIFASGFSTAAKVTDVSGRGVGMDMVKASVEAVGGKIEIDSTVGAGSIFTLRLPIPRSVLIINSLIVESAGRQFAIPQDSIARVLRIAPDDFSSMIQNVASGLVLRTADAIYPFLDLNQIMGLATPNGDKSTLRNTVDVLIVRSDILVYALRVDAILDIEEIVVKRLQHWFNPSGVFAGATFMGDGSVGLILDTKATAMLAGVSAPTGEIADAASRDGVQAAAQSNYVLFRLNSKSMFGVPLDDVYRLEELDRSRLQMSGSRRVAIYRDRLMSVVSLQALLGLKPDLAKDGPGGAFKAKDIQSKPTVVVRSGDTYVGLEVEEVVDIASTDAKLTTHVRDREGILGNTVIREQTVAVLDLAAVLQKAALPVAG